MEDRIRNQIGEIVSPQQLSNIPLSIENLYNIIELQLKDLHTNLRNMNTKLKVTKTAKDILIQDGSHREWGARPLRREIQNEIENVISSKFLNTGS